MSLTDGLIAYYKLDELSGTTANDSSGNSNHGTYNNGPSLAQTPIASGSAKSVDFNRGSNQYISLPTLSVTSAGSISMWCRPTSLPTVPNDTSGNRALITLNGRLVIYLDGDVAYRKIIATCRVGGSGYIVGNTAGNNQVAVDTNYHVVLTYDNEELRLYINATHIETNGTMSGDLQDYDSTGYVVGRYTASNAEWDGFIDDVRVYNRALSAGEVYQLYTYTSADEYFINATIPELTASISAAVNNPNEGIAGILPELTASISATNTPPNVYVAAYLPQFTAAIEGDSTFAPTVLRLCTHSFTTDNASTPANTHLPARVKNPGNYSRAINLEEFGLVRPAFGEVVINNIDGQYDYLIDNGFDGQKIKLWYGKKGATFPDDFIQVLVGIADAVQFDSQYIKLTLKDNLALLDQPVMNESFRGTGGTEGTTEWTDRRKQRLFGGKEFVPVQLIDAEKLIYFVSKWADDDPLIYSLYGGFQPDPFLDEDTMSAWEGGLWIEREANYASVSEMETFEPSTGKCRFLIDGSGTYVRLATNPEYEVRVTVPSIRPNGTNQTLTHQMLITEVVPSDEVWNGGGAAIQDIFANDESMTYADVLQQIAIKEYSYFWSDRFGQLRRNYFQIPGFKGNNRPVKYEFNESNIKSISVKQAPHYYRVEFKAGLNFPSVPAPAAYAPRKEQLSRTGYTYTETRESNVVRNRHKSAKVKQIFSHAAVYDDSRRNAADVYESVYIQPRQFVEIEHARGRLTQDLLGIDITDHVTLQYPRFGFDNGKTMLVLAVRHDYSTGTLKYTLWG